MRLAATTFAVLVAFSTSIAAGSSIIAHTSFEEPAVYAGYYIDTLGASGNHYLIDNANQPLVNFTPAAGQMEMGFRSYYENTRNDQGLADGDNVGASNFTAYFPSGVGYSDGSQGFEFSDTDGRMTLILDAVDMSNMRDAEVSVEYFVNGATWEVGVGVSDEIRIWVEIDGGSSAGGSDIDLLNSNGQDIDAMDIEEAWTTLSAQLPLCATARLKISLDSNAADEALFVDNVQFSANQVPEPTTFALLISAFALFSINGGRRGVKILKSRRHLG